MGIGPVPAIQNVLKVSGLTLNDIDLIEVSANFLYCLFNGNFHSRQKNSQNILD